MTLKLTGFWGSYGHVRARARHRSRDSSGESADQNFSNPRLANVLAHADAAPEIQPRTAALNLPGSPPRYYELDSLRGVAALTVVLYHFTVAFGDNPQVAVLQRFPLRLLTDGHQAVLLFFLLSGFVLTLPYKRRRLNYPVYLIRRVCRIYLPYLGALMLAVLCDFCFHGIGRTGHTFSDHWVHFTWSRPITWHGLRPAVLFLGDYDWSQYDTAFWSLIYEMRISLVFPFAALALLRMPRRYTVAAAVVLSLLTRPLAETLAPVFSIDTTQRGFQGSELCFTLHYFAFFLLGGVMSRSLDEVGRWFTKRGPVVLALLFVATLMLYDAGFLLHGHADLRTRLTFPQQLTDWISVAGALLLMAFSLHSGRIQRLLHHRAVHHLGQASYSLYLVHGTVLFSLLHFFPAPAQAWELFALYLPITAIATALFYRFVEKPTMRLGQSIAPRRLAAPAP